MNKDKIVEELNEYMKGLDPKLSVENDTDGDLALNCNNDCQAWFDGFDRNSFDFNVDDDLTTLFADKGCLTKFYHKAIELMDKYEAKYTVKILPDITGYLSVYQGILGTSDCDNATAKTYFKTHFTQSEIEELKKRDNVAVDWDKAIIKEVTD